MSEKTNIKVKLESKQNEVVTQFFDGELYVKGEAIFIKYVEEMDQQEIRHLIRYTQNELKVTRYGIVQSEQIYRLLEKRVGFFDNNMIRLQVEAFTKHLAITDAYNQAIIGIPKTFPFHLLFDYDLFVDGELTGSFEIRLTIEEAKT